MQLYIIGTLLLIISSLGVFIFYQKSELATITSNNIKLQESIEEQKQAITDLKQHAIDQKTTITEYNKQFNNIENKIAEQKAILDKHDLTNLADKKPKLVEKAINNGIIKKHRELKDATDPKSYNIITTIK